MRDAQFAILDAAMVLELLRKSGGLATHNADLPCDRRVGAG